MAYWRSYRRLSSQVNAFAAAESGDDENILENDTVLEPHSGQPLNGQPQQNELAESALNCNSSNSSDDFHCGDESFITPVGVSDSDSETDEDVPLLSTELTLRQELNSWATKNACQHGVLNELLDILRKQGHDLPKDARTLLETPRSVPVMSKCGGEYLYFGIKAGVIKNLSKYSKTTDQISSIDLLINVDGLPLFKSSSQQFWPILGQFNNLDVFVIALFYGPSKPSSIDEYLHDFLEELDKLQSDGISYKEQKLPVHLKCFCCDAPARCFLKCIVGHTGYFACERCIIKGMWNGRVVFNSVSNFASRTDEQFDNCQYEDHQKARTPLIGHGVSCVQQFCLDYMHLVCLGVTKRILFFLRKGPRICKLSSQQINQISSRLVLLKGAMPSEFARQPRSLLEVDRWKATEFRQFLLYTGPIVLRGIVSNEIYEHFLSLSVAVSLLLETNCERRNAYLDYARKLLEFFVKNCQHMYGDTFTVYNVHSLLHLADDVRYFNCSLNEISCFPFENYMQQLKKHVRSGKSPIVQVAKRVAEISSSCPKITSKRNFAKIGTVSENFKDCCFLIEDKFAFVKEKRDDGKMVCAVFSESQVESFYCRAADSKLFKVVSVRRIEQRGKRRLVEESELHRKAVCLPINPGYVIFPLHHEMERKF